MVFGSNLHKEGLIMDSAQNEKQNFLEEITKPGYQLL